jgi:hypothetical protein
LADDSGSSAPSRYRGLIHSHNFTRHSLDLFGGVRRADVALDAVLYALSGANDEGDPLPGKPGLYALRWVQGDGVSPAVIVYRVIDADRVELVDVGMLEI